MKYLSAFGLALVLVIGLAVSVMAVPTTLTFDNNDLNLGTASQINLSTQYLANWGLTFDSVYRYIDSRDPFADPFPFGASNFGISNGFFQQNDVAATQGRINFVNPTPYVDFDWWTIGTNGMYIEAFNSGGVSQGSFSNLNGSGTASLNGDISYILFHDGGGLVQFANLRYDSPIPEPSTLLLLGTGLLGLGAFRFRRKK